MTPREIKGMMVFRGVKIVDIARHLGVSQVAVTRVVQGRTVSARIRLAIARAIGKKVDEIWPREAA